jgi:hypothetical protein
LRQNKQEVLRRRDRKKLNSNRIAIKISSKDSSNTNSFEVHNNLHHSSGPIDLRKLQEFPPIMDNRDETLKLFGDEHNEERNQERRVKLKIKK